jgi:mono/diheme cytochrome c family protein
MDVPAWRAPRIGILGEGTMRHTTSSRRASLTRPQLLIGFAVVILLIVVAVAMTRGRARTSLGGISRADPANAALVAAGRQLYDTRCASCHGARLEGQPNWQQQSGVLVAPPLDETSPAWRRTDRWLFAIVKEGGQAVAPPGAVSAMPAFGGGLSDEQIWAALAYIKSTWPQHIQSAQPQT